MMRYSFCSAGQSPQSWRLTIQGRGVILSLIGSWYNRQTGPRQSWAQGHPGDPGHSRYQAAGQFGSPEMRETENGAAVFDSASASG